MPKAFFSYAHADSELVHAVASRVGRPFVSIDFIEFHAAQDLLSSMECAIRESSIFVCFASQSSLKSLWVNFEINEARFHQALVRIRKTLVILLDDRLKTSDFPSWMQRSQFLNLKAASPIARRIRALVDELLQDEKQSFFVGRAAETAALQSAFVPLDLDRPVSLVAVRGLPGIGRRTLISRVAKDTLRFQGILTLRVEAGDDIKSLAIKLADLVEPVATADDSLATAREIEKLSSHLALERLTKDLEVAGSLNELVVLYDDGGLLDNDGIPRVQIQLLLQAMTQQGSLIAVLVTNRRPNLRGLGDLEDISIVDVRPLQPAEVMQLLALTALAHEVKLTQSDMAALTEQIRGYPPAAMALVNLVKTYGSNLLVGLSQKYYQPRPLTRYLKSLKLESAEYRILQVLASNSPLPVELIAEFGKNKEQTYEALVNLIDTSLVLPDEGTSWYRISEPIVDYIKREFPACNTADYGRVSDGLERFLKKDQGSGQYLELARVYYRALLRAGREKQPRAYALVADWLRLVTDFYHDRNFEKALNFATLADESNRTSDTLSWIIKCKVKLSEYDDAINAINELRRLGDVKEAHFLLGFLERHRSRHDTAILHYEDAREAGRGGVALERDLADCYLQVGNLERASAHILEAQGRQPDNRYIVALRIKIACKQRDEETARNLLFLLRQIDDPMFADHRQSRIELEFGHVTKAYQYAQSAVAKSERPPFEALTNLALCQIRTDHLNEAKNTLVRVVRLYRSQRPDVQNGLRARIALAEHKYEDALGYCVKFQKPEKPAHLAIKRDALRGLLEHIVVPNGRRQEINAEVQQIDDILRLTYGEKEGWEIDPE